jgi:hypothetical protein
VNFVFNEKGNINMAELKQIKQRIGTLEVIERVIWSSPDTYYWVCRCDCGNVRTVEEKRLVEETITMCVSCEIKKKMGKLKVNLH